MSEKQTGKTAGRRAQLRAAVALALFALLALLLVLYPPGDLYLWIKALHIIAVISWMAGLLYLPRLFVYHTDAPPGSPQSETFKVMEQRLYGTIMRGHRPAASPPGPPPRAGDRGAAERRGSAARPRQSRCRRR